MLGFVTLPLTLFFLFPSSGAWVPVGPKALLHISNANISPDGIDRPAIVVNGQHPGPLIRATKVGHQRTQSINAHRHFRATHSR